MSPPAVYPPAPPGPACPRQLFIDSYNKRKPDNTLDVDQCHLETGSGAEQALGKGDTIGATITDRADVYVRPGATEEGLGAAASAAAAATAAAAEAAEKKGESLFLFLLARPSPTVCARAPWGGETGFSSSSGSGREESCVWTVRVCV